MTNLEAMNQSLTAAAAILDEMQTFLPKLAELARTCATAFESGHKLLACGNGGSAADAQHLTGEWLGRFRKDRRPYPALSLNADTVLMTAVGNDYGFDDVFARQVHGLLLPGDICIGFSTSGNSANVEHALSAANDRGGITAAFLGRDGGRTKGMAHHEFIVNSTASARIQEAHGLLIHLLCEETERLLGHK